MTAVRNAEGNKRLRALIVDDEPDLADVVLTELTYAGVDALSCTSVAQAKTHLAGGTFDLVVSDVRMPGETGVDLLKWIRKRSSASPRVILMTAFANLNLEEALHCGADALFMKPFDFDAMIAVVGELMSGRQPDLSGDLRILEVSAGGPLAETAQLLPGRGGCFVAQESSPLRPGDLLNLTVHASDATFQCPCLVRWCRRLPLDEERPAGLGLEFLAPVRVFNASGQVMAYPWANVVPFIPSRRTAG